MPARSKAERALNPERVRGRLIEFLFVDWGVNNDPLARIVLMIHRLGAWGTVEGGPAAGIALAVYRPIHLVVARGLLGVDIPRQAQIGRRLRLHHGGRGLVIHRNATLGDDCVLFHNVTIGQLRIRDDRAPRIGNRCRVWPGAVIAGPIVLDDDVEVGANEFVRHSRRSDTSRGDRSAR